jgi:hypothetical protein
LIHIVDLPLSLSFPLPRLLLAALLTLLLLPLSAFFPLATLLALLELPPRALRVTVVFLSQLAVPLT